MTEMTSNADRSDPEMSKPETAGQGIRLRAIVLGVILAVAICALTPLNNVYRQATLRAGHRGDRASRAGEERRVSAGTGVSSDIKALIDVFSSP